MPTARERMLELSPLTNTTARLHFLATTQSGGVVGGRADLTIKSESDIIDFIADNEHITTGQDASTVTLTADKKGITL
jgi:hypothetical protein